MLCLRQVLNLLEGGEKLTDIAVITPYKAQVEKIKEVFRENFHYFSVPEGDFQEFIENRIYTVDSFQGREEEIVIISWVRSNYEPGQPRKTGFLKDFRRVNVSLSRARKKMILIGDYETLTNSDNLVVRYIFRQIKNLREEKRIIL
jgi:DNA polymerase alpha-associated DNA helicase A